MVPGCGKLRRFKVWASFFYQNYDVQERNIGLRFRFPNSFLIDDYKRDEIIVFTWQKGHGTTSPTGIINKYRILCGYEN